MRGPLFALALLGAAGCYSPSPVEGLPCSPNRRCPEGQMCGTDGICRSQPLPTDAAVYDAAVDGGVDLLIDPPVRISESSGQSDQPSLVWTGSEYGVAWVDDHTGNTEIHFARVSASGKLLGSVRVTDSAGNARTPSLVWTGSEYGLAWADEVDGNFEIYFTRITPSGSPVGMPKRITNDTEYSLKPSLVWTGTEFGVAWEDSRGMSFEIYFARLALGGTINGAVVPITDDDGSFSANPSLVWTGTGYGLAWDDDRDDLDEEIYFTRVSDSGAKSGGDIRVTNSMGYSANPSLVWTGNDYGVLWADLRSGANREIYFARLAATGVNTSGQEKLVTADPGDAFSPSAVYVDPGFAVAWRENPVDTDDVFVATLDGNGAVVGSSTPLADGMEDSMEPSLVWTGSVFAAAWSDDRDGNYEIYLGEVEP